MLKRVGVEGIVMPYITVKRSIVGIILALLDLVSLRYAVNVKTATPTFILILMIAKSVASLKHALCCSLTGSCIIDRAAGTKCSLVMGRHSATHRPTFLPPPSRHPWNGPKVCMWYACMKAFGLQSTNADAAIWVISEEECQLREHSITCVIESSSKCVTYKRKLSKSNEVVALCARWFLSPLVSRCLALILRSIWSY